MLPSWFSTQDIRCKLGRGASATPVTEILATQPLAQQPRLCTEEQLRADAHLLLDVWLQGNSVQEFLQKLPQYVPSVAMDTCIAKFRSSVQTLLQERISSSAAMQTTPLIAETLCYPFAVMLMAASIASATPIALLLDTVLAVVHSLVNKNFHLNMGRWENKSRFWFVGTAETGEGKRGAMKPVIQCAHNVLRSNSGLMHGTSADDFHMQQSCTTAAAIDKLRHTDGYLLLHSDEAGQCLDLSFSGTSAGGTKKGEHVDLTMFLDAAHGDEFSHTTMLDRKRAARREPTHRLDPVQEPPPMTVSTNMEVSWLQQELYFLQYWCLAAFTKPIGLVQRCLFSFGRALPAPEPSWNAFWRQVFLPFLESIFQFTLTTFGPKAPEATTQPLCITPEQEQLLFQMEELLKVLGSSRKIHPVAKGAMPKCLYWLGTMIRTNFLLEHSMDAYLSSSMPNAPRLFTVQNNNFLTAINFLSQRYLFGMMVVATSVAERSWSTIAEDPKHSLDKTTEYILQVLRAIPFRHISQKDVFHACLDLAWQWRRGRSEEHADAECMLDKIFYTLQATRLQSAFFLRFQLSGFEVPVHLFMLFSRLCPCS